MTPQTETATSPRSSTGEEEEFREISNTGAAAARATPSSQLVVVFSRPSSTRRRLRSLPEYLVVHLSRFKKNQFGATEKNPTIVTFPVDGLNLSDFVDFADGGRRGAPTEPEVAAMSAAELSSLAKKLGLPASQTSGVEKSDLAASCLSSLRSQPLSYNLQSSVSHASPSSVGVMSVDHLQSGSHRVHLRHDASMQWFEVDDERVKTTMPQLVALTEGVVLVFKRRAES